MVHYFLEGPKFTCKKKNICIYTYVAWGPCFVLEGPCSSHGAMIRLVGPWYVLRGPGSSCGALVHLAGPWFILRGPDSSRGVLISLAGPESTFGVMIRPVGP